MAVRWGCEESLGKDSYSIDVSEREKGKEDGGSEWRDVHAAGVRVRC